MRDVAFCTDAFASPITREYSERVLASLLWALIFADESWILVNPFPPLYRSGVRWEAERPTGQSACKGGNGQERFLGISQVLEDGKADCEDLASWRVAELRLGRGVMQRGAPPRPGHPPPVIIPPPWPMKVPPRGVDALPAFFGRKIAPNQWLYHIIVAWPSGSGGYVFEDPSRVCGMGGRG